MVSLAFLKGGGSSGSSSETIRWLFLGLGQMIFASILFPMFVSAPATTDENQQAISDVQQTYFNIMGSYSTPEQNVWSLTGIYTPYEGENYGYTPDGWVYGTKIVHLQPQQYSNQQKISGYSGNLIVQQADNGLWYYIDVPRSVPGSSEEKSHPLFQDIVLAHVGEDGKIDDYTGATVYSAVHFDVEHKSDIFFTPSSKTVQDDGQYYYAFSGYRYVYSPLSSYSANMDGKVVKIDRSTTSLSLIWYQYATNTGGIAGQLAINGDQGVSYLAQTDIIKAFNSANLTSKFDMVFNSVTMHLVIRIDPYMYSLNGGDIEALYNQGYFSVLVYSDQIQQSTTSPTYEFSLDNVFSTMISILTFHLDDKYQIDGWMSIVVSLLLTVPMYIALIGLAFENPALWVVMAIMALVQAIGQIWPF